MERLLNRRLLWILVICVAPANAGAEDIPYFVYRNIDTYNPFTGRVDNRVTFIDSDCRVEGFPVLIAVSCNPNGMLEVPKGLAESRGGPLVRIEGKLSGWFLLNRKEFALLRLGESDYSKGFDCPLQDTYAMPMLPITASKVGEKIRVAINSIKFGHKVRLDIQGCVLGRPRVVDVGIVNCDQKCLETLTVPLAN